MRYIVFIVLLSILLQGCTDTPMDVSGVVIDKTKFILASANPTLPEEQRICNESDCYNLVKTSKAASVGYCLYLKLRDGSIVTVDATESMFVQNRIGKEYR